MRDETTATALDEDADEARERIADALERVHIPEAEREGAAYGWDEKRTPVRLSLSLTDARTIAAALRAASVASLAEDRCGTARALRQRGHQRAAEWVEHYAAAAARAHPPSAPATRPESEAEWTGRAIRHEIEVRRSIRAAERCRCTYEVGSGGPIDNGGCPLHDPRAGLPGGGEREPAP